ncbi:MAG: malonate decarboxylase subunit alpha [Kiritimatiellae bacterium]|jgi:malonate decarboxylase alpha subunit|nr:malonate decarboxylase subunit alpha [Kiritimatiellia bacterium]NLD88719.1 malonate decarboxylase subunit alpha [Lentisphaerota bacterium]HPC20466.1 malonate decarboxylase subunit alpha [Kiritimatiellia bacterium]HQN80793.1 malonate decarboxylase subunit alpha [Kiritimatiellia bacterium]
MKFNHLRDSYLSRTQAAAPLADGKFVDKTNALALLQAILHSGDRVCIEGDNQKQADFFARELVKLDPARFNRLHMVQSTLVLNEHLELFRRGIADRLDFAYSGPQSKALFQLAAEKKVKIGAIHTYLELYGRYFVDLYPQVAILAAEACDEQGNIYTGGNTEDSPTIAEATRFKMGVVVVQVKEKLAQLPRVDIPASWVDFIVVTGENYHLQPLFTRNPGKITNQQILMAMMALKGIYQPYGVQALNHGLGYATAAIELLLPTYGAELGLKGRVATRWVLNPHPTLIPAIEAGFVEHIYAFGGEPGMEDYVRARPDIFAVGPDGSMRSNRCSAHIAGLYAIDLFIGATLQIDRFGNSSTAIQGMIAGFGGAPNLGGTPPGRRHNTTATTAAGAMAEQVFRGRKLVVQMTPTRSEKKNIPVFVEELDAQQLHRDGIFPEPPIMIAADQVTHILTETGIAYLDKCPDPETRRQAVAAVAGDTPVGATSTAAARDVLRSAGIVRTVADLGIDPASATTDRLPAHSLEDLVTASGGLYRIPAGCKG